MLGLAVVLASCAEPEPPWYKSLQADSPCYRVNLADGLDETDTTEVQDLFACLNHHQHLQSLEPTARSLEQPSPDQVPAAIELARAVNALPTADLDPFEAVDGLLGMVDLPEQATVLAQDITLELIYGQTAFAVRNSTFDLNDGNALQGGVLAPIVPVVPPVAMALHDDPAATQLAGELLVDPETHRWIRTVAAWAASEDPRVHGPLDELLPELGRTITATQSPSNDRWTRASGDSLRDLTDVATRRRARGDLLEVTAPELRSMLADRTVQRELPRALVDLQADGHLGQAVAQLGWLGQIDVNGGRLDPDEDSALTSLIRLLYASNRPMRCRIDIWVTVLDVDLGNLAVSLLRVLADQDPDNVQDAAGLFGRLLGYGLSDGVLRSIADSGSCPTLTQQVVTDLTSLDRLSEPSARDLTHTLIGLLRVLRYGEQDHVPEVVTVLSESWLHGLLPPLEELLRDIGDARAVAHATELVPVMDRPDRFGIRAGDEPATTLSDLLDLLTWLVEPDAEHGSDTGWQRLRPLILPATHHDGTWRAVHTASSVLGDRNSALARLHELLPPLVEADSELQILQQLGPLLSEPAISAPILRLAGTEPVVASLLATHPQGDHDRVPLAFAAHLIRSGTLDDLLRLIKLVVDDLRTLDPDAP